MPGRHETTTLPSQITFDQTPRELVLSFFEDSRQRRLFNPAEDPTASERLRRTCHEWQAAGKTVVFSSGVYDLMHANHKAFLLHTRLAGAERHWRTHGQGARQGWEELSVEFKQDYIRRLLEEDALKQVVSVRGNESVAARKGNRPEKGNTQRPIYDWETRARDVLSAAVEISPGRYMPLADAVTIHDEIRDDLAPTPHSDILSIADFLQPDVWSIYFESQYIIDAIGGEWADRFADVEVLVLTGQNFYSDELLGGPFTTTNITRRLGGAAINGGGS